MVEDPTIGCNGVSVVHGLSVTAGFGAATAMLGANGAGKTTTLLAIAGDLRPTGDRISVLGQPAARRACH